jgi:hypothetical protein
MRVREIVRRRFPSVDASWRKYIGGAIYIPQAAQPYLSTLRNEGPKAFLDELERLAALGSPWASAFLGYQALLVKPDGSRDVDRAIHLCKEPAASGDAYAAYVLGWAVFLHGDPVKSLTYIRRSARQLFPPAVLDLVAFYWMGRRSKTPKGVLISLRHSRIVGHYATLFWRSKIYRSGRLGYWRLILGYILTPIGYLYWLSKFFSDPFSARRFVFDIKTPSQALVLRG